MEPRIALHFARTHRLGAGLTLILLALIFALILALGERGVWHGYNQTVGPRKIYGQVLRHAGVLRTRARFCSSDQEVRLVRSDGFATAASIYYGSADETKRRPGVIIMHGNTALGRRLSTYQLLATMLADKGYTVLTYDRLGFGESDNPHRHGPVKAIQAFDRLPMAVAAVRYLMDHCHVEKGNISVIGHSAGALTALKVAQKMDEIKNVILIGPPRRVNQRAQSKPDNTYFASRFHKTYEYVYGQAVPDWHGPATMSKAGPWSMEEYVEPYLTEGHRPLMLIDGELESEADKRYLENYFDKLAPPKKFVRLRGATHYCNTAQSLGLVFFDHAVAHQLLSQITAWIERPSSPVVQRDL